MIFEINRAWNTLEQRWKTGGKFYIERLEQFWLGGRPFRVSGRIVAEAVAGMVRPSDRSSRNQIYCFTRAGMRVKRDVKQSLMAVDRAYWFNLAY